MAYLHYNQYNFIKELTNGIGDKRWSVKWALKIHTETQPHNKMLKNQRGKSHQQAYCLLWSLPCPGDVQTLAWGVTGMRAWRIAFSQLCATSSPTPVAARTGLWELSPLFSPTKYTILSVMISKQCGLLPCETFVKSCGEDMRRISESGIS